MKVTEKTFTNPSEVLGKTKGAEKKSPEEKVGPYSTAISKSDDMSSAKVKLSEKAADMKKIKDAANSSPDVDEAKVQKYKSMLAKGEYKVDSKAVADKMVDEHLKNEFFLSNYKDE